LGPRLSQGYLALRRNEAQRSSKMTLEDEIKAPVKLNQRRSHSRELD
jgi:hypothetical protein